MSTDAIATLILTGSFGVLLVLRVPITFALAFSAIATVFYLDIPMMTMVQRMLNGVRSFSLLAIPFFILAGQIMGQGGISQRMIEFSNLIVGRARGGLAQVNVMASMFFGGISGSAVADVSSIGSIMMPVMKKKGYDADYSVAVTVTSACQGIIIPPSHNMIIYSLAAGGVSIGSLFLAGVAPGVILGLSLMIVSYIIAVRRGYPKERGYSLWESLKITADAFLGLLTAAIIIGGVISGVFTATESAAIACVYAFVITFFWYREVPLKRFLSILYATLKTLAMVMSLIAAATAFGWLLALLRVPEHVTTGLLSVTGNPILLLLLINLMLLLLGMIMDMAPLILITTPVLYPITVEELGMHPVHFGILLMLNLGIGLCTPPVGSALFVGAAIGRTSIENTTRAMLPFYAVMLVVLMLVTFVSGLTLWIPELIMGR